MSAGFRFYGGWLMLAAVVLLGCLFVEEKFLTIRDRPWAANETAAIRSLMAIDLAEAQYRTTYPAKGYACSLTALGGDSHAQPLSPDNAPVLQQDLASGMKAGYLFRIATCTKVGGDGMYRATAYTLIAQPVAVGRTGRRTFCSDESGEIKFDPMGGTSCTQVLQ